MSFELRPTQVEAKTKVTKQAVEAITRGMEGLKEVTDVLKDTMQKADDAETLAHDALQSIDARADLITRDAVQRCRDFSDNTVNTFLSVFKVKGQLSTMFSNTSN